MSRARDTPTAIETVGQGSETLPLLDDVARTLHVVAGTPTPDEIAAVCVTIAQAASTREQLSKGKLVQDEPGY